MLTRRALLGGSVLAVLAPRVATARDPLDDLLTRVALARAAVRTLRGPFTQIRTIGLLAVDVRSTGMLVLVRPDRLRWDLAPPDEATFFVGPEGLAYRGAHSQARAMPPDPRFAGALDDLRTLLGGDLTRLRERWDLRLVRDDASGAAIGATPRAGVSSPVRSMGFALAPDLVRPSSALLVEGPRDRTVIEFGTLVVDSPVDPATMRP